MRRTRARLAGSVLLALSGCAQPESVSIDLVESMATAELRVETSHVSFGEEGSRPHVGDGWSEPIARSGRRLAYYPSAALTLTVTEPRPLTLELRGRPAFCLGERPQVVTFEVNGTEVARRTMRRGPAEYRLELPAEVLVAGENHLRLLFSAGCRQSPTRPELAAAWETLRIAEVRSPPPPGAERAQESSAILLPFGSQVSFYLTLPAAGRLAIDRITPWGRWSAAPGEPTVILETRLADAAEPVTVDLLNGDDRGRGLALALPGEPGTPLRVTLRAVRGGLDPALEGGYRIRGPVIRHRPARGEREERRPGSGSSRAAAGRPPNVVLYLVDTLRADHLGVYGYDRPVSPHVDAFASEATVYTRATAQSSWTRPAVATVFTGLDPLAHGVHERHHALGAAHPVMAQLLAARGYQTIGITTNVNVYSTFGFARGFARWHELPYVDDGRHQASGEVNRLAFRQLDELSPERPFFLFLHTMDPHAPYSAPDSFRRLLGAPTDTELGSVESVNRMRALERSGSVPERTRADLVALYDAEIARNDASFGELVAELRRRGLYESSLIVFLSDHGEAFGAHGEWAHGSSLFDDVLRIPLLLKLPRGEGAGRVVDSLARQEDLLPTLLDYLGEPAPPGLAGRSLLELPGGSAGAAPTEESLSYLRKDGIEIESLLLDGWKLIRYPVSKRPKDGLYRISRDPGETDNLIDRSAVRRGYLEAELRRRRAASSSRADAAEAVVTEDELEQLRALGYIR